MVNSRSLSGSFAHLLALDVEATCDDGVAVPRREMETIEIGAVIVNAGCELVDEFQTFVKPIRHARLTPLYAPHQYPPSRCGWRPLFP
jgi:inhibitor of KinA sporulation pathway (predicted exonuclease)